MPACAQAAMKIAYQKIAAVDTVEMYVCCAYVICRKTAQAAKRSLATCRQQQYARFHADVGGGLHRLLFFHNKWKAAQLTLLMREPVG